MTRAVAQSLIPSRVACKILIVSIEAASMTATVNAHVRTTPSHRRIMQMDPPPNVPSFVTGSYVVLQIWSNLKARCPQKTYYPQTEAISEVTTSAGSSKSAPSRFEELLSCFLASFRSAERSILLLLVASFLVGHHWYRSCRFTPLVTAAP